MVVAGAGTPASGKQFGQQLSQPTVKQMRLAHGETEGTRYLKARQRYLESRYLAGTRPLSPERAGKFRAAAARDAAASGKSRSLAPAVSSGAADVHAPWNPLGPQPTFQYGRSTFTPQDVSGRVSTLAMTSGGVIYSGAAQGGLWKYDPAKKTWTPLTDGLPSLAVGAVAIAPRNENVIYLATGEGDLSGDSYYGDGVWRSSDAGKSWSHVSGNQFPATSISRLVVDPKDPNTLYVATIRGRGGSKRVSPPTDQTWGVFKSTDAGHHWTLLKGTSDADHGATDIELDPNRPGVLYASFWQDGMYRSNAAQTSWTNISATLPIAIVPDFTDDTRFSMATAALPNGGTRLYAGFDWHNSTNGVHRPARIFRSDDRGASWTQMGFGEGADSVLDYCGEQCSYDNVVEVDPNHPEIVYAGGSYNYSLEIGGIYRSMDGGATWQTLGLDLHPDYHALAFQPGNSQHIAVGNDGGVWDSPNRGGRTKKHDGLEDVNWRDLNDGLSTTQFDSVDFANAANDNGDVFWGGTQDNGTQVTVGGPTWYDVTSGDGGQVVVDHVNDDFVFGTYYQLTGLYRFQSGPDFFTNANIMNGIDLDDRSEFYIPLVQNEGAPDQLLTGTYRVYRTDNGETPVAADVQWQATSDDLTSGCSGAAANGGRACVISALGVSDGGAGAYAGTEEGWVWSADDAMTSVGQSDWARSADADLPGRPVSWFAVDRSDWRTAYVAYAGYDAATPGTPGHVFKTTDGGVSWANVTGNLPDNPVNSLELDPSDPDRLFAATDVGPFVTEDGGQSWTLLGTGIPRVGVWQGSYDPSRGLLVAGTHGRGAWTVDTGIESPAMVAQISDPGVPVGPGTDIDYTITIRNVGNADATDVTVTDPVPANTGVHTTDGEAGGGSVTWSGLSIPAGESVDLHLSVTIDDPLDAGVTEIVNDGLTVTTAEGAGTHGSPHVNAIANQFAATVSPPTEIRTAQQGRVAGFRYTVTNTGYGAEAFDLSVSGNVWDTAIEPDCTTPGAATGVLDPGEQQVICVGVTVPGTAAGQDQDGFTLTASPAESADAADDATAEGTTVAITNPVLLVDQDGDAPDVQSYYTDALDAANVSYDVWDVASDPDLENGYLTGYDEVYWFAGTSWPSPLAPYEKGLITYLDSGGKLFMSGLDILDQSGGTTPFASNYLHVDWDDSADNDVLTAAVHGVPGSVIGGVDGTIPITPIDGFCDCLDELTLTSPAEPQYTDDAGRPDALAVTDTSTATDTAYQVVFLAFPFEEMGSAADRAGVVTQTESFFGTP